MTSDVTFHQNQFTQRVVDVAGYSICVYELGRRSTKKPQAHPPIVFCNGLGSNFEAALPFLSQFTDRDCISFDVPGTGQSPASIVPLTMKQHSQLVLLILVEMNIFQCDLVGYSWGGVLAQCLAMEEGSPVRNLILIATSAGGLTSIYSLFFWADVYQKTLSDSGCKLIAAEDSSLAQLQIFFRLWGLSSQVFAVNTHSHLHQLSEIQQPTLVISGREDRVLPTFNQQLLKQGIRNCHWQTIEGGHLLLKTHPRELSDSIAIFCA